MKKTYIDFVVDQWSRVPSVETVDLSGKTIVVVGANTGIGFEAAKHFARMNPAKLLLACRNESKGQSAGSELERDTGFTSWEVWKVDLADFASVTSFAERFERECDRLDILVMNAGIGMGEFKETVDGWEINLQVNYLGTSLLSLLLLPRLVDTGKKFRSTSRLVIVSSELHYWVTLPDDVKEASDPIVKLSGPNYRDPSYMRDRYIQTKLMNVLFTRALQDRLQTITPLTVNTVNPGFCYSKLRRDVRGVLANVINVVLETLLARSSEQGSRQLVYAAIAEQDNEDHMKGAYINKMAVNEPSDFVISEEGKRMQEHLWGETIDILTKVAPQLRLIVEHYII